PRSKGITNRRFAPSKRCEAPLPNEVFGTELGMSFVISPGVPDLLQPGGYLVLTPGRDRWRTGLTATA
ncbi:MAG: hypothetical protein OXJ53_18620, partial [Gammaproteobacteria bacterium]|nr:hypothetical protein [Gammaproteobacteria bacterium]